MPRQAEGCSWQTLDYDKEARPVQAHRCRGAEAHRRRDSSPSLIRLGRGRSTLPERVVLTVGLDTFGYDLQTRPNGLRYGLKLGEVDREVHVDLVRSAHPTQHSYELPGGRQSVVHEPLREYQRAHLRG